MEFLVKSGVEVGEVANLKAGQIISARQLRDENSILVVMTKYLVKVEAVAWSVARKY